MPVYILKCQKCKTTFDFYRLRGDSKPSCPKCGSTEGFDKQPTIPSIVFKGEGWQTTNFNASIDPTTVPGVKKIELQDQRPDQKTLYKKKREVTGRRRKVKVQGLQEKKRQLPIGKA